MFNVYSKTVQGVIERYFTCIWKIFIMSPQKVDLPQKQREESKCDNCIVGGHQNNAWANLNFSWMLRILIDVDVYFNIAWTTNVFPIWWRHNSRKIHQMHVIFLRIIDMLQNTSFLVSIEGCGTLLVNWFFTGTKKYHFNFSNIKVYPLLAKDALSPRVARYNHTNEVFW